MDQVKARAEGHFDGAWWETLDQGKRGSTRVLLKNYVLHITDIMDVLHSMKHAVTTEDFGGDHVAFCDVMRAPMRALVAETKDLMLLVQEACADGVLTEEELGLIDKQSTQVKKLQDTYSALKKKQRTTLSQL